MILKSSVTRLLNYEFFCQKTLKQIVPYVTFKEMQGDGFAMTNLADYVKVIYRTQDSHKGGVKLILFYNFLLALYLYMLLQLIVIPVWLIWNPWSYPVFER